MSVHSAVVLFRAKDSRYLIAAPDTSCARGRVAERDHNGGARASVPTVSSRAGMWPGNGAVCQRQPLNLFTSRGGDTLGCR